MHAPTLSPLPLPEIIAPEITLTEPVSMQSLLALLRASDNPNRLVFAAEMLLTWDAYHQHRVHGSLFVTFVAGECDQTDRLTKRKHTRSRRT